MEGPVSLSSGEQEPERTAIVEDVLVETVGDNAAEPNFVRRSIRNPEAKYVERGDVKKVINKIRSNDESTVVFKLKDHTLSDITPAVLDMIIEALADNKVCQALYVQNVSRAMGDTQLKALTELLKTKMIWCLNIGENYEVTKEGWVNFCDALPSTNVTHLYVSEHIIPLPLKNRMRDYIRFFLAIFFYCLIIFCC